MCFCDVTSILQTPATKDNCIVTVMNGLFYLSYWPLWHMTPEPSRSLQYAQLLFVGLLALLEIKTSKTNTNRCWTREGNPNELQKGWIHPENTVPLSGSENSTMRSNLGLRVLLLKVTSGAIVSRQLLVARAIAKILLSRLIDYWCKTIKVHHQWNENCLNNPHVKYNLTGCLYYS
jgi:hypothetical protein